MKEKCTTEMTIKMGADLKSTIEGIAIIRGKAPTEMARLILEEACYGVAHAYRIAAQKFKSSPFVVDLNGDEGD